MATHDLILVIAFPIAVAVTVILAWRAMKRDESETACRASSALGPAVSSLRLNTMQADPVAAQSVEFQNERKAMRVGDEGGEK